MVSLERDVRTAASQSPRIGARLKVGVRAWTAAAVREPLVHFFLIGILLLAVTSAYKRNVSQYRIEVTRERVEQLSLGYRLQFGAPPSRAGLASLIDRWIDDEVLYREGLARGLDRDDEIVRRRIVQKAQFLQQDLAAPSEPSDARLEAYYQRNRARYATPQRVTFSHIYFSPDRGGDEGARERAGRTLATLDDATPRAPGRGDSFPDLYDYADFGPREADRLFGDSPLALMLFQAPTGRWSGPYKSGYGWHLIYIQSRLPSQVLPLSSVRDQVRADAVAQEQAAANRRAFEGTRARYAVVRDDLAGR